jgi:hypothetical protein
MALTQVTDSETGPFYASGAISFSSLRTNFKKTSTGSVKASQLLRDTTTSSTSITNPTVPDATENSNIVTTQSNWKVSDFRNSIKYYVLSQGSGDTDTNLNIGNSSLWNGNLGKNIVKRVNLNGTSGSTDVSTAAARLNESSVYNVLINITGEILGAGGSAGSASGGDGGNGGDALNINTNNTGKVKIKTIGNSSKVYGGGAGGGAGGNGGDGGNGSYTQSYSYEQSLGGSGQKNISGGQQYYDMCHNACRDAYGGSAYCKPNCYKLPWEGGCGCTCFSYQQGNQANCTCCYKVVSGTNTYSTSGGAGGDGGNGAAGRGYNNLTGQLTGIVADPPGIGNGPTSGGTNAGDGGQGGDGGDGGTWGADGGDGGDGGDGTDGNVTNGQDGDDGGNGGTAGRAVAGSGYLIDPNGVSSAYKGLK